MKIPEENFNTSKHFEIWIENEKVLGEVKVDADPKVIEMKIEI